MANISLRVNGKSHTVDVDPATPLLYVLRNDLPPDRANWIKLCLKGNAPNTMALGAVVTVKSGDLVQRRMVRTGSSYLSQSDCALVCGLGKHAQADQIEIRWPSGKTDTLGPAAGRRTYELSEADPRLASDYETGNLVQRYRRMETPTPV